MSAPAAVVEAVADEVGDDEAVEVTIPPPRPFEAWAVDPGTEAILVQDHRAPLVTVQVRIPVGTWSAAFRALGGEGAWDNLAWDPGGALRARADALGVSLDTWSAALDCGARISALAEDAPAAVDLLRDVLHNTAFDPSEVRSDTRNARIGYRTSERDPRFLLRRAVDDLFWAPDDPRALATRPPVPGPPGPNRLARAAAAVLAVPGRLVGLSGDLDRAGAEALVARLDLPPVGQDDERPIDPPTYGAPRVPGATLHRVEVPRATQAYFAWSRPSVAFTDPAYPALRLAAFVLGQGSGSRLNEALRQEEGDTYGVGVSLGAGEAPGLFTVQTFTRTDNADALAAKFDAALASFATDGITERERADAVSALRGRELFSLQSAESRVGQVMWGRMRGLSPDFSRETLERMAALSLDEVNAFVADFFRPDAFTPVRTVPE